MTRRFLVVSAISPWCGAFGAAMRMGVVVEALADLGTVDICLLRDDGISASVPEYWRHAINRCAVIPPRERASPPHFLRALAYGELPFPFPRPTSHARREITRWADGCEYDLVWYNREHNWLQARGAVNAPQVVDIDDFQDVLLDRWGSALPRRHSLMPFLRWKIRKDSSRWQTLHSVVSAEADLAIVTSDSDIARLPSANVAVVPNSYPVPNRQRTPGSESGSTLIFQGLLTYGPNADAAKWAVREILPLIREVIPGASLKLVGEYDQSLNHLKGVDGVELTGVVEKIDPYLQAADIMIAPIRWGSGTRIKIIEAFAHGLPVVSTTIGADGLAVQPGKHLEIADEAGAFATACISLLMSHQRRSQLRSEADSLFRLRYTRKSAIEKVQQVAIGVLT